jgi:acyl carrier protein
LSQRDEVIGLVGMVIEEINEVRPPEDRVAKALDSSLLGNALDSLGAVTLMVGIDERVLEQYGVSISPVDALAKAPAQSPLRTVATLVEYVMERIGEGRE